MFQIDRGFIFESVVLLIDLKQVIGLKIIGSIDVWLFVEIDVGYFYVEFIFFYQDICFFGYVCKGLIFIIMIQMIGICSFFVDMFWVDVILIEIFYGISEQVKI